MKSEVCVYVYVSVTDSKGEWLRETQRAKRRETKKDSVQVMSSLVLEKCSEMCTMSLNANMLRGQSVHLFFYSFT